MTPTIAATVYAMLGFSGPFGLAPRLAPTSFLVRCFAVWLLTALILFFVDDQLTVLVLAGVVLVVLAPSDPVHRIGFFLVAAPSLPAYLQAPLPFPGINWLVLLTYYKVVVFVVLTPVLFRLPPRDNGRGAFSLADASLVVYIVLSTLIVALSMGLTAGPRFLIDQLLLLGIPYLALSRGIRSRDDLDFCFRAILLASLILASIAVVATLKQWDFYRLKEPPSVFLIPDIRSGLIRIAATANTHSLGYHLAIGILFLQYLKKPLRLGFVKLWLFRALLLAGLLSTDSRGSVIGLTVAFFVYGIVMVKKAGLRWAMLISLALAILGAGLWLMMTDDASSIDAYNSVGYRQLLFQVSIAHILEHPIFGDLGFMRDAKFAVLLQGQGIIDITSLYLQIGLSFGLVGLVLFFGLFALTMRDLMRCAMRPAAAGSESGDDIRRMSALILAALVGWLILIATTSDVALTLHLGLLLIALGRAIGLFATVQPRCVEPQVPTRLPTSLRGGTYPGVRPASGLGHTR